MDAARVLIVSDVRLLAEGLLLVLAARTELEVVGAASSWPEATSMMRDRLPQVALVDMLMAESHGGVRALVRDHPQVSVVGLAVPEREEMILSCMEAGIAGYVSRDGSVEDLLAAVEGVRRGEFRCSPRIAACLARRLASLSSRVPPPGEDYRLTPREKEVLSFVAQGMLNKQIARRLSISVSTVKNHVHNILEKMDVRSRVEAVGLLRESETRASWQV